MQVNRRSLAAGFAAILASTPAFAAPHKAAAEPIFKVDTVSATADEGRLVITARGAVSSGGWTNPYLRQKNSKDAHVMAFEFVAVPPPPDAAVIQALVPIEARTTTSVPLARISEVRVDAASNEATIAIPDENADQQTFQPAPQR